MRITLGMTVEAWIATDAAPQMGAWRAGEVVWGNGHSYVMRWHDGGPDSDRILRKFVRPLPDPTVKLPADLVAGDFVEVLDGSLWKLAEVVGAGHGGQFEVKVVGSARVLTADQTALRPPQVYNEKGWVVLHKGNKIPIVPSRPIAGKNIKSKANGNAADCKFAAHAVKLGKTKRSNYAADADIVRDVKRFQGNGDDARTKFLAKNELAPRYHHENNVEVIDVHPTSHYLMKREEPINSKYNNEECEVVGGTNRDDDDSDDDSSSKSDSSSSSSGDSDEDSSSSSSNGSNINGGVRAVPTIEHCQENQEVLPSSSEKYQDSDEGTESRASASMHHQPANEEEVVMVRRDQQVDQEEEEEQEDRVHGLELEAYLGVMKAFHATGSLSWAKEELLSNLRLHLHVSSDEHLQAIWLLNGKKKPAGGPRYC